MAHDVWVARPKQLPSQSPFQSVPLGAHEVAKACAWASVVAAGAKSGLQS
jgi:hypothetical protein